MKDNALYLEVDEDITSAIDKLSKAPTGPVQIVVPKRSTMLQSIINLKLLKKAADASDKQLVLVTGDHIASELAARVGLAVAPSVGAKAVMISAKVPEALSSNEEVIDAGDPVPPPLVEPKLKPSKKAVLKRMPIGDGPLPPASASESEASDLVALPGSGPSPLPKTPKVPNFHRLQRRIIWVALAATLVVGYMGAMYLFTTAKVVLYAAGTKIDIDTTFAVDPALKATNTSGAVLAGQLVTISKDLTGPFAPSGKQDAGTKATGTITITNSNNKAYDFVAGTRFQAPDGKIFHSTTDIHLNAATATIVGFPPKAVIVPSKQDVSVIADANGDTFNEAPTTYSIPGLSSAEQQGISGQGGQMSGGTTKTITIVAQADVDTEKAALLSKDQANIAGDLGSHVPSGYFALTSSQNTQVASVTPSPAVGAAGDTATLTIHVTYTELAVKRSEYASLVSAQEQKQVGTGNQIYDDGLATAQITATASDPTGRQSFHLTTEAYGGAKIDKTQLATKLKGLRYGDAANLAAGLPGVSRADITIAPAWVSSMPQRTDKISITIQVAANK